MFINTFCTRPFLDMARLLYFTPMFWVSSDGNKMIKKYELTSLQHPLYDKNGPPTPCPPVSPVTTPFAAIPEWTSNLWYLGSWTQTHSTLYTCTWLYLSYRSPVCLSTLPDMALRYHIYRRVQVPIFIVDCSIVGFPWQKATWFAYSRVYDYCGKNKYFFYIKLTTDKLAVLRTK